MIATALGQDSFQISSRTKPKWNPIGKEIRAYNNKSADAQAQACALGIVVNAALGRLTIITTREAPPASVESLAKAFITRLLVKYLDII